jgi:acylphosphatase
MDAARALGLNGWVRNRKDGTVEALFTGSNESVDEMVVRCHQGPPSAIVESVNVTDAIGITDAGFKTLPTV